MPPNALEDAVTHFRNGRWEQAQSGFEAALRRGGLEREWTWVAAYLGARAAEALDFSEPEIVSAYLQAFEIDPRRAEPLHRLARYFRERRSYVRALLFGQRSLSLPLPDGPSPLLETDVYAWRRFDEVGVAAYWVGDFSTGLAAIDAALSATALPEEDRRRIERNRSFYPNVPSARVSPAGTQARFCIWVVTPPGYAHAPVFDELAEGLREGFAELGEVVQIVHQPEGISGRALVLGCSRLPWLPQARVPPDAILFNLEQASLSSGWISEPYLDLLRRHEVIDYSEFNIQQLRSLGVTRIKKCGIGYATCLTRVPAADEDVDVLFYGSMTERRRSILDDIERTGLRVERLFGVYGAERDRWIARSKIILNLHAHPEQVFEIARVSYLLSNRKFVLSERSRGTDAIEHVLADGIIQGEVESLPALCRRFADDHVARKRVAQMGFEIFRSRRQSELLRELFPQLG